jgi:dihydroflavonol-4-reductase
MLEDGMKVFLTGGTGFIGRHLVQTLLQRGWEVVALVRRLDSPEAQIIAKNGAILVRGDVTNPESMRSNMAGADIVIHSAGFYEVGIDEPTKRRMSAINVEGTRNVLNLAQELQIKRCVYVSSVAVFGSSGQGEKTETVVMPDASFQTHYERTKHEAHLIAQVFQGQGLPLVIVCPNLVVGANDHSPFGYILRLYLNGWLPPVAWSPEVIFSHVEVGDVAVGIALAAEKGLAGETYLLCGEAQTRAEMFKIWESQSGAAKGRVWLPVGLTANLFWLLEPLQRASGLPAFLSRETVLSGAFNRNFSSAKACRELGWTYRSAKQMWLEAIATEQELMRKRLKRDLVSKLKPLPEV